MHAQFITLQAWHAFCRCLSEDAYYFARIRDRERRPCSPVDPPLWLQNPGSAPGEVTTSAPMHGLGQRLARDPRDLGREEEDYFSAAGDDDDVGTSAGGPSIGSSAGVLGGVSSVYMSDTGKEAPGGEPGARGGLGSRQGQGQRWGGDSHAVVRRLTTHPAELCTHCVLSSISMATVVCTLELV